MNHRPLVLVDVETTGGSARYARITEIGALRIERGKVVATFNQLVNPEQPIPRFITKLTGITNEMVWQAPTFARIAPDLEAFLDGAVFVAHHVAFDYSFITAEFKRVGVGYNSDRLCSVKMSRRLHLEQRRHGLDQVIERLGLQIQNRHRAFDDAEVIWKFFEAEYKADPIKFFRSVQKLMVYSSAKSIPPAGQTRTEFGGTTSL